MVNYLLDDIAREHIFIEHDGDMGYYPKVLTLMRIGMREINLDIKYNVATKKIKLDNIDSWVLPEDYIDYIEVYTIVKGEKKPLLNLPKGFMKKDSNGQFEKNMVSGLNATAVDNPDYGMAGQDYNKYGYFTIVNQRLAVTQNSPCELYIDYLSNQENGDQPTKLHPYIIEPLKSYCKWKMHKDPYNSEYARQEFYKELKRAQLRLNSFNIDEFKTAWRSAYMQTNKR